MTHFGECIRLAHHLYRCNLGGSTFGFFNITWQHGKMLLAMKAIVA